MKNGYGGATRVYGKRGEYDRECERMPDIERERERESV